MSASTNVAAGTFRRAASIWVAEMSTPVTVRPSASARGHRDAGAAAELQDVAAGGDQLERQAEVAEAGLGGSEGAPGEVALGDRVVALGDDPFRVHRAGVSARR